MLFEDSLVLPDQQVETAPHLDGWICYLVYGTWWSIMTLSGITSFKLFCRVGGLGTAFGGTMPAWHGQVLGSIPSATERTHNDNVYKV